MWFSQQITGGANGLGKLLSLELASLGCKLAIADVDIAAAEETAKSITDKYGVPSKAYKVDVSNYSEILKLKENILSDLGEVDILVNNAALIPYKSILDQSAEELERLTRVNFNSVMLVGNSLAISSSITDIFSDD